MRECHLYMLSCAALLMACQPVTPVSLKTESASPSLKINNISPMQPASIAPTVPQAPPMPSVPTETLSSGPLDQNNNQTEIDLAISTVAKSSKTPTNSAKSSPDITPKASAMPKTFDPTKIIGFATPALVHNLGRANMVRKEGLIEVWQYHFGSCVVDFFFYPTSEDSSQLILKIWDMRSTIMGGRLDRGSCHDQMNLYHQNFLPNS